MILLASDVTWFFASLQVRHLDANPSMSQEAVQEFAAEMGRVLVRKRPVEDGHPKVRFLS